MPAISSKAPGKIILCGEHAVVYGTPAIALPVFQVTTRTTLLARPTAPAGEVRVKAPARQLDLLLTDLTDKDPLRITINLVLQELGIHAMPACEISINSSLPLAAGLGSSASVTISLVRALSNFLGHPLADESVNQIAYEIEKIHHGTPSGIDNTVITYQKPVIFQKDRGIQYLHIKHDLTLVIADSGVQSSTAAAVAGVHERWQRDTQTYERYFQQIGEITNRVASILADEPLTRHGTLLSDNHRLLQQVGVSTPMLDELVETALTAGASGAKLSGGGLGGTIIALVETNQATAVAEALIEKGAVQAITTTIPGSSGTGS